jgi:hypothetical protein
MRMRDLACQLSGKPRVLSEIGQVALGTRHKSPRVSQGCRLSLVAGGIEISGGPIPCRRWVIF